MDNIRREEPLLIDGGLGVDDRGEVAFVNGFNFTGVKRFYAVSNHRSGFIRAWHAHKNEAKYVLITSGAALVGAVKIDNFESPDKNADIHRFILQAKNRPYFLFPLVLPMEQCL